MIAVKDRLGFDTLYCPEQERDERKVFCCNKPANPPYLVCCTSVGLMCGGFAFLMPLSNNYFYKLPVFSSLHGGQD